MADQSVSEVEYRAIDGFEAYRVGNDGTVWSRWKKTQAGYHKGTKRVLSDTWTRIKPAIKTHKSGKQYETVILYRDGGRHLKRRFFVHHLVLLAFIGPRPDGLLCCHKNDNSLDNRDGNLRWGTQQSNIDDQVTNGCRLRGSRHRQAIHTDDQINKVIDMILSGKENREIVAETGIRSHIVCGVRVGSSWTHLWAGGHRYIPSPNISVARKDMGS